MFNQLIYNVTFVQTGRNFQGNHSFNEGMTAITGPNGKGKSLILEMIRYALHGTSALRGKADDYQGLSVNLVFTVNKVKYEVSRAGSKVKLCEYEGKDLATGTKPVNGKIAALFGYSAAVFNVANSAAQGEIEALGNMLPTARKKLVDETIGLTALDELTVFIGKEITTLNSRISTMDTLVIAPTEPEKVEGLESEQFYIEEGAKLNELAHRRTQLQVVANKPLVEPVKVEPWEDDARLEEYQGVERRRLELITEAGVLGRQIAAIPSVGTVANVKLHERDSELDQLQAHEATRVHLSSEVARLTREEAAIPESAYTQNQLTTMEVLHNYIVRWKEKQTLMARRVPHDCPACKHHWDDEDPRIATEYSDVQEPLVLPELTMKQIAEEDRKLQRQPEKQSLREKLEATLEQVYTMADHSDTVRAIFAARKAYAEAEVQRANAAKLDEFKTLSETISKEFDTLTDYVCDISRITKRRVQVADYKRDLMLYTLAKEATDEAKAKLAEIPGNLDVLIWESGQRRQHAFAYALAVANYAAAKERFDKLSAELERSRLDLEDWKNGRDAVVLLRARVKGYILPSLNLVASKLLNEMTGGELSGVQISEEFEITVDGQRLETLSGAGKGVANLALRLSLGQVLTNSVFPALMLDEIDASMDNDRSTYVAQCLRRLAAVFKQILLVTHKHDVESDHRLRL